MWLVLAACAAPPPPPKPPVFARPVVENALVVAPLPASVPDRLPHTFEPTSYAARIHVDPGQPYFSGTIEITGELAEASALIWLHAEKLRIRRVTASRGDERVRIEPSVLPHGMLALQSEQPLQVGSWTISISYLGSWDNEKAEGGIRQTHQGEPYVYTQFEPDYARTVFPCFDEPDRKVPWQLTLDVPDSMVAASNAPIESEMRSGGPYATKTVRFAKTLPVPSYLVAFAVGPFEIVDAGSAKGGIPVRILALRSERDRVARAATVTPQLLDKVESWLGVPFPYPKLDVVTVPKTAPWWAAMENPGLITVDQQFLSEPAKWDSTMVHEIAHHWFGDYVTPAWWDDIWLNESFAAWIARKLGGDRMIEFPLATRSVVLGSVINPRMQLGGTQSWDRPGAAAAQKGARLLELLEKIVGPDTLLRALRQYLTAHPHGTVQTAELRAALETAAGPTITRAFDRYIQHETGPLEPVLTCSKKARTLAFPLREPTIYPLLACVAYDHDGARRQRCVQIEADAPPLDLGTKRCPRWILVKSLHRLRRTVEQLEALRDHAWPSLSDAERRELLSEAFVLDSTAMTSSTNMRRLRLSFAAKTAGDDDLLSWATTYVLVIQHQVPPALRAKFDAWVSASFSARARAFGIAPANVEQYKREQMYSLLSLVLDARDKGLIADALALLPKLDQLDGPARVLVLRAALLDKPSYADDLVAEIPKAKPQRQADIGFALESVPDLLFFLTKHAAEIRQLQHHHKARLFGLLCDENRRQDVESLGHQLFDKWGPLLMRDYDWCTQERKALEPELRAFLNGKP